MIHQNHVPLSHLDSTLNLTCNQVAATRWGCDSDGLLKPERGRHRNDWIGTTVGWWKCRRCSTLASLNKEWLSSMEYDCYREDNVQDGLLHRESMGGGRIFWNLVAFCVLRSAFLTNFLVRGFGQGSPEFTTGPRYSVPYETNQLSL